jgi:hypothetical protein
VYYGTGSMTSYSASGDDVCKISFLVCDSSFKKPGTFFSIWERMKSCCVARVTGRDLIHGGVGQAAAIRTAELYSAGHA